MALRDDFVAEYMRRQKKKPKKAKLARHTPDRDTGGARWREGYEDWRSRNRRVVGWSRKSTV